MSLSKDSRVRATADRVPAPPAGYRAYTPDRDADPSFGVGARVVVTVWILAVVGLGVLVWMHREQYGLGVVGIVVVTAGIHEVVHAVVGWLVGLEVTAGFAVDGLASGPYVMTFGEFQTRRESAVIVAAPVVVLTPIFVVATAVGGTVVGLAALAALFVNTLGALFDFVGVLDALRLPAGVLEYHTAKGEVWYYAPTESATHAR